MVYHPHMQYPLDVACRKDCGAELVNALVHAGAQMELSQVAWGCGPSTNSVVSTPLFKAAYVARYDRSWCGRAHP